MSWNNNISFPNWAGSGSANNYVFPSISSINISASNISATNISTYNLTAYNGYISYSSNITTTTNAVILNPATILTGNNGVLYVNGEVVATPSNTSNVAEWSKYQAISNVNMNSFSLNNVSNINNCNQIVTNTLVGLTSVVAPTIQAVSMSATTGYFPALTSDTFSNSGTLRNTGLSFFSDNVAVSANLGVGLDITCDKTVRAPNIDTSYASVFKELRCAPIFPYNPNTGSTISPSTIITDTLIARNSISTILISTGTLFARSIDVASNIIVPDIVCSNITVVDTATAQSLNVEGTATIYGLNNTGGANFQGGISVENILNLNCDLNIDFETLESFDPLFLPPKAKYLYDIKNARNLNCASLTVVGGATGNTDIFGDFTIPFHYNTNVVFGNSGGITCPAVVEINGQNPGIPGENITNALVVRGDMAVDFGILTTYNGLVCEPFNLDANAIEVNGISALNGATNVVGSFSVEGSAGILGNTTITGACEVTGGCIFTGGLAQLGGDFTLGANGTEYTGTINTPLTINNVLGMNGYDINGVGDLNAQVVNATNVNATNFITSNIFTSNARIPFLSTNTVVVYQDLSGVDIVGGISFSDISGNQGAFIGLGPDDPYPLGIASLNGILTFAVGSIVTDAGVNMELTAQQDATLTGVSNVTMQCGTGNATVVSASGTTTIHAYDAVSILSDTAGIALEAETGVFMNDNYGASFEVGLGDITATASNINLTASNIYLTAPTTANDLLVNTIRNSALDNIDMQTTGNMYLGTLLSNVGAYDAYLRANRNVSIFGGNKNGGGTNYDGVIKILTGDEIEIRSYNGGNITLDNTTVPIGVLNDRNILITAGCNISMTAGTNRDISFGSRLNMSNNSIVGIQGISSINANISTLRSFNISTTFLQASSITATNTVTASTIITDTLSGLFSNNIKVAGHLSTMSLGVSTINFKAYPFVSTLSNAVVTASAPVAGVAVLTRLQSNALRFPFPGTYKVFQKYSISKGSGGGIHGSLIYSSNGATTATVANATNWPSMGMASCPFQDSAGVSTLTTAVTTILVNSGNLTRDLYYYDSGSGNYTASFYISPPTISYIPSVGITPDI
jgi:hypothetical protein